MWRNGDSAQSWGGGKLDASGLRGNWSEGRRRCEPRWSRGCAALPCPGSGARQRHTLTPCQLLPPENASSVQPAWPPVWVTCFAICHCQMFLYSASATWFATHLTPCIINFASQLTRCVIIFASHFGLCILITVCNGPRGRLQLGGAGSRCWPALAPTGAARCRERAQGLPAQTGPGGARPAAGLGQLQRHAATCCFSSLTRI